jgi:hypothetical protein
MSDKTTFKLLFDLIFKLSIHLNSNLFLFPNGKNFHHKKININLKSIQAILAKILANECFK